MFYILQSNLLPTTLLLVERILHIPGIPEYDYIYDKAQHSQLILLPLPVSLTKLASLAMKHMAGDTVSSLATIQLCLNAPAIVLVVKKNATGTGMFFLSTSFIK